MYKTFNRNIHGAQWYYKFDNGYEVSVIQSQYSLGGNDGLFEALVSDQDELVGYLTFGELADLLDEVQDREPS